jgi:hypothetical protein
MVSSAADNAARLAMPKSKSLTPLFRQHDVPGLEIEVDDAGIVSFGESVSNLNSVIDGFLELERTSRET